MPSPPAAAAAALTVSHIDKRFGPVVALDDVSLEVARGEVFALVGENGAGKSTLMNVVSGLYRPDRGGVSVFGKPLAPGSPARAIAAGVGMVHQHFMLVPPLTVAENVVLGREPRRGLGLLLDRRAAVAQVEAVARRFGFDIDPLARVEQIGVGMQQRVEIVKALYRGAELLILDEPTANLTPQESADLFRVVRELAAGGKTVIFISHKLREVLAVADRIAVIRRGRIVATVRAAETNAEALAALVIGGDVPGVSAAALGSGTRPSATPAVAEPETPTPGTPPSAAPVLVVDGVHAHNDRGRPALRGVSFELRGGEILAVAGVDGNGQSELAEVVTGLRLPDAGAVQLAGPPRAPAESSSVSIRDSRRAIAHIPADRLRRGLCPSLSVEENLALGRQDRPPFARGVRIDRAGRAAAAARLIAGFDIRPADAALPARALSGGNQQKVILARELDGEPRVVVAVQPTRGLDIGAIARVHERLRAERARGRGVLLVSLDLDEVLALADRILVLYGGEVMGVLPAAEADPLTLGRLMLGQREGRGSAAAAASGPERTDGA